MIIIITTDHSICHQDCSLNTEKSTDMCQIPEMIVTGTLAIRLSNEPDESKLLSRFIRFL